MLFDEESIRGRWEEYVQELYDDERGDMPTIPDEEEDSEEILVSEVEKTIRDLKIGKAPGMDQITTEMIKALDEYPVKVLTGFCNIIYNNGKIPGDTNDSIIREMPEKTKATKCEEHRTLSLMSHVLKLMLEIILRRSKFFEEEISDAQSGFINGKGTREGIFTLHTINERYTDLNRDVFTCFIDYEKAFDKVNHKKMVECLINVGLRGKEIRFIRNLYWEQKAFIKLENSLSKEINIKRGVRQGCVLSPFLFNLYTELIFTNMDELEGVNIGGHNINNLRYADDTVLLAENQEQLQKVVDQVNTSGKEYGMRMNSKKTKIMNITRNKPTEF